VDRRFNRARYDAERLSRPSPSAFETMSIWQASALSSSGPFRSQLSPQSRCGCGHWIKQPKHDRQEPVELRWG